MPLRPDSDLILRILNRQSFLVHLRGQTQLLPLIHQGNDPIGLFTSLLSNLCHLATSPFANPVAIDSVALPS